MAKIITIANQKGGVGKTTTSVNLSACVAQKNKKVLIIDIDPQGNTSSGFGIDKAQIKESIYNTLVEGLDINACIQKTMIDTLDIIPANVDLAGAEIELVPMLAREHILKSRLEPLRETYDYIFIDCPPSLGLLTLNALTATDRLMVPIQCEYYALEGLSQLMNTVQLVKQHLNPSIEMEGVVLTMFDGRTNLSSQVVKEVKKFFKNKVYDTVIPRNVRLGEAPSYGLPITLFDSSCIGAQAYSNLADEVISSEKDD